MKAREDLLKELQKDKDKYMNKLQQDLEYSKDESVIDSVTYLFVVMGIAMAGASHLIEEY